MRAPPSFVAVIKKIQEWFTPETHCSEAIVSQQIVLQIIQAAGFDIWNPKEVIPQETSTTGTRPDFLVYSGNQNFVIEVKATHIIFNDKEYKQAANDAIDNNSRWAILTNGHIWSIVDIEANNKPFKEREVFRIECSTTETEQLADELYAVLGREYWENASTAEMIEQVKKRRAQKKYEQSVIDTKLPLIREFKENHTIIHLKAAIALYYNLTENQTGEWEKEREVILKYYNLIENKRVESEEKSIQNSTETTADSIIFYGSYHGKKAKTAYSPKTGKWILLEGSELDVPKPQNQNICKERDSLEKEGFITQNADGYLVIKDIEFNSPSGAAKIVTATSVNGWVFWKDASGNKAEQYKDEI